MYEQISPFGPFFRNRRNSLNIGIWPFCVRISMYPANLVRIEKGVQDPRLDIALKMVCGLDIMIVDFFTEFCDVIKLSLSQKNAFIDNLSTCDHLGSYNSLGLLFGDLLCHARRQTGRTQKMLAETAGIHLRNLTKIENGAQIPRVMTAIRLVCATGCGVRNFFNNFEKWYRRDILLLKAV